MVSTSKVGVLPSAVSLACHSCHHGLTKSVVIRIDLLFFVFMTFIRVCVLHRNDLLVDCMQMATSRRRSGVCACSFKLQHGGCLFWWASCHSPLFCVWISFLVVYLKHRMPVHGMLSCGPMDRPGACVEHALVWRWCVQLLGGWLAISFSYFILFNTSFTIYLSQLRSDYFGLYMCNTY